MKFLLNRGVLGDTVVTQGVAFGFSISKAFSLLHTTKTT